MNFEIGTYYTLDDIRQTLGGPLLASFATHNNKLIYIKVKQGKDNPNVPDEISVRDGKNIQAVALQWLEDKKSVPLFWRPRGHKESKWLYHGFVKPSATASRSDEHLTPFKIRLVKCGSEN